MIITVILNYCSCLWLNNNVETPPLKIIPTGTDFNRAKGTDCKSVPVDKKAVFCELDEVKSAPAVTRFPYFCKGFSALL